MNWGSILLFIAWVHVALWVPIDLLHHDPMGGVIDLVLAIVFRVGALMMRKRETE